MNLKRTKPRRGAKPLTSAVLTVEYLKRLKQNERTFRRRAIEEMERAGIQFESREQAQKAFVKLRKAILKLQTSQKPLSPSKLHPIQTKEHYAAEDNVIPVKLKMLKNGRILIHQQPFTHQVTGRKVNSFSDLISILESGLTKRGITNANIFKQRTRNNNRGPDMRDSFFIEVMSPTNAWHDSLSDNRGTVNKLDKTNILSVNISLETNLTDAERKKRIKFYQESIKTRFGFPLKFIN